MFVSESSPEFIKRYREIKRVSAPSTPMQANLLVTVLIATGIGLGALGMHYFHDWDTTRATIASVPFASPILKYLPEGTASQSPRLPQQVASGPNTLH
jgi:hypothetical protein